MLLLRPLAHPLNRMPHGMLEVPLSTYSSSKMRMDGNIREMKQHRRLPALGMKSKLSDKTRSLHLSFDVSCRFDERHCRLRTWVSLRPPIPKSALRWFPSLALSVSLSSSPHLIFTALTLSFKCSIRAPVCWYIHHLLCYSFLDATYALNPSFEYSWFVSLPYLLSSKMFRQASRRLLSCVDYIPPLHPYDMLFRPAPIPFS